MIRVSELKQAEINIIFYEKEEKKKACLSQGTQGLKRLHEGNSRNV